MKIILVTLLWLAAVPQVQVSSQQEQPNPSRQDEITHSADTLWIKQSPENVGALFSMPEKPRYSKATFDKVVENPLVVHKYRSTVNGGTASFVFVYNDIATEMATPKIIKDTLDGAVLGANARVLGSMQSVKKIRHGRHKGREFVYAAELNEIPYMFSTRIVLVNQRLYQLILVMTRDSYDVKMARKYFDSFELAKNDLDLPPKPKKSSAK